MVRSTFFGLEIGKTGLTVSQVALDITGHNIANVDTKGYTRQRIVSTAYDPFATIGRALPVSQANVGGGVNIKIHDQIRSAYLDRRYRTENTLNAYWQKRTESLRYLESYFDNVNEETSINFCIARFFEAMKTLASDTVGGAQRTLLHDAGQDLAQQLNLIYEGLVDLQGTQNQTVTVSVSRINGIAAEIAELNKSIYGYEITGYYANDLRDKRNLLIDELSTFVDVEYREYPDGKGYSKFEVTLAGGQKLVDHVDTWQLGVREIANPIPELAAVNEAPVYEVYWLSDSGPWGAVLTDAGGNSAGLEFIGVNTNARGSDPLAIPPRLADPDSLEAISAEVQTIIDDIVAAGGTATTAQIDRLQQLVNGVNVDATGVVSIGGVEITTGSSMTQGTTPVKYMPKGGELKAYLDMRDGDGKVPNPKGIPYYIQMLNNLARALVQEINMVHRLGWTDPPVGDSQTGINFFNDGGAWENALGEKLIRNDAGQWEDTGGNIIPNPNDDPDYTYEYKLDQITARNLRLSDDIIISAYDIACSSARIVKQGAPEELERGNNENINALYDLFRKTNIALGNLSVGGVPIGGFDLYATSIRFDVGNTLNTAIKTGENSNTLTIAAENQRIAVAGVSLDEEMTNLIKYQHAYNGAARVITAMDDALDRLINGTGRVGL